MLALVAFALTLATGQPTRVTLEQHGRTTAIAAIQAHARCGAIYDGARRRSVGCE